MSYRPALDPRIASIRVYVPGKPMSELEREAGLADTIKLASNENPLGPSPAAVRAMQEAAREAHRYPDGSAWDLRHDLARHLGVPPEAILVGNGSTEIVELIAKAFLPPDGESVVSEGAFIMYRIASLAACGAVRGVPLDRDFRHDLAGMARAVSERTRVVFIANPNNPTGTAVGRAALEEYFRLLPRPVLTVLDEAYREYADEPDYPDGLEHLARGRAVVVLRTFSKIHGLAGARVGYAVGEPGLIQDLEKVRSPFNTSAIAQAAARAALTDREHVSRSRAHNDRERARLEAACAERGVQFVPSRANFVLLAPGPPGPVAYARLLERGVITRPMEIYGFPDHLRVSVGTAAENSRFLEALDEVRRLVPGVLDSPEPAV